MFRRSACWLVLALFWVGCKQGASPTKAPEPVVSKEASAPTDKSPLNTAASPVERAPVNPAPALGDVLPERCTVDSVRRVVRTRRAEVGQCYSAAVVRGASHAGRVAVEIHVEPSGVVRFLGIQKNDFNDEDLARCLFDLIRPLRFEPTKEPCVLVYPFAFSAG